MYCASLIWEPGDYDSEFERLNEEIERIACSLPGYLGVESWQSTEGSRRCASYYWTDLDTLKGFSTHPTHLEAKRQYSRWFKSYHVVVSEVIRSYGNGMLKHITPNSRDRSAT